MHPDPEQLHGFVSGTLDDETADRLADHVEQCEACEQTVRSLESASDTFVDSLRTPVAADPVRDEPECREMIDAIRAFGQDHSLATRQADAAASDEPARHLGQQGQYKLLDKLGEGGMGAVYRALHTELDKIVAVKVLSAQRTQDADAVDRFKREMRVVAKLDHPHIVRAMDAGEADGEHFLVMEYVKGPDLAQLVQQHGHLPISDACELIRQAAIGLDEAHDHGIVHRDIKPSNLILAQRRRKPPIVKILDMGLARLSEKEAADVKALTSDGQMMGTLDYMAPEQGKGAEGVDIRADVYGLGATLYKLLCGQAPFGEKKYDAPVNKLMALATEEPPSIAERREGVSPELAAVVHKMLAKQPSERYATPEEVAMALAPFCSGANLAALAQSTETDVDAPPSPSTTSLRKEAVSLDTASRGQPSADEAPPATIAASRTAASSRRKWVASFAVALGLTGVLLAAAVFVFRTPNGTVTVEVDDRFQDEITIVAKGGGEEVEINSTTGWQAKLKDGTYQFTLKDKDSADRFRLSENTLKVTRGQNEILRVTYQPVVAQLPSTPEELPITPLNGLSVKLRHDFGKILGHTHGFGMDFSPDGKLLAVGGVGGVHVFDTATGELHRFVNCLDEEDFSKAVAFSPDGLLLAILGYGTQNAPPKTVVCTTKDWNVSYRSPCYGSRLTFSPDGKQLACHSGTPGIDLQIFDAATGELVHRCSPDDKPYWGRDVAYSPDGKHILTTYHKADPHIWNAETGELVQVVDIDTARTYTRGDFLSDRTIIVEAGDKSYVVNLQTNARKTRDDEFWTLSHDRELAASRGIGLEGNDNVILWSTASGKVLAEITDHTADIREVAFSPDGKSLATSSDDETLKIWDLRRVRSPDREIARKVFALGGSILYLGDSGFIRVSTMEELPVDVELFMVTLPDVTVPTGFLAKLHSLGHPIGVEINGVHLTDEHLSELAGLHITRLQVGNAWKITDQGLDHISRAASITELELLGASIQPDDYGKIRDVPGIASLSLGGKKAPSAAAWRQIAQIESLRCITLWYASNVADADLIHLAEMKQLERIRIHGSPVTDAGLKHLHGSTNLKWLDLELIDVTAEGVAAVRKALPNCEVSWDSTPDREIAKKVFALGGTVVRNGQVRVSKIEDLPADEKIWCISIENSTIPKGFLARLKSLDHPISLQLGGSGQDELLGELAGVHINALELTNSVRGITGRGLEHLSRTASIRQLSLGGTGIASDDFGLIRSIPGITDLGLGGYSLPSPKAWDRIAEIETLRTVTFNNGRPQIAEERADANLMHLAKLDQLTRIVVSSTAVSDAGLKHLHGATNLKNVDLAWTNVTEAGVAELRKALPKCEVRWDGKTANDYAAKEMLSIDGQIWISIEGGPLIDFKQPDQQLPEARFDLIRVDLNAGRVLELYVGELDQKMASLEGLSKLEQLSVNNTALTDKGLAHLANLSSLKELKLGANQITSEGLRHLKDLRQLTTLELQRNRITDTGLAHLAALPLTNLDISGTSVTSSGMQSLAQMQQLQSIRVQNTLVSDEGLAHLRSLKNLEYLDLQNTRVTDAAVEHLAKLTQLQTLHVSDTKLTVDGVAKLKLALPKCTIQSDFTDDEIAAAMAEAKTTSDDSDRE